MQRVNLIPLRISNPKRYQTQVDLAKRPCMVCGKPSGLAPNGEANTYSLNGQELPVCSSDIWEMLHETPRGIEALKSLEEKATGKQGVN